MKIPVIIQARMGSKRFFGKVLSRIEGKSALGYLLERLKNCNSVANIIVATSTEEEDAQIANFCKQFDVSCYRGSLLNVASRFKEILEIYGLEYFARLSADSPLFDQRLLDKAVEIFGKDDFDIVTNIQKRTYPKGQSIEIFKSDAFKKGYALIKEEEDLEHVTKYFYKNYRDFSIFNLSSSQDYSKVQLSLDEPKDMDIISSIIKRMRKPHWQYGLEDILQIYYEISQV